MTAAQAADFLSLSKTQVCALCKDGKLTGAEKMGTAWIIPRGNVEVYQYLKRRKHSRKS